MRGLLGFHRIEDTREDMDMEGEVDAGIKPNFESGTPASMKCATKLDDVAAVGVGRGSGLSEAAVPMRVTSRLNSRWIQPAVNSGARNGGSSPPTDQHLGSCEPECGELRCVIWTICQQ